MKAAQSQDTVSGEEAHLGKGGRMRVVPQERRNRGHTHLKGISRRGDVTEQVGEQGLS